MKTTKSPTPKTRTAPRGVHTVGAAFLATLKRHPRNVQVDFRPRSGSGEVRFTYAGQSYRIPLVPKLP